MTDADRLRQAADYMTKARSYPPTPVEAATAALLRTVADSVLWTTSITASQPLTPNVLAAFDVNDVRAAALALADTILE